MYFIIRGINKDELSSIGIIFYYILYYSSPVFIIGPFIFFALTKKVSYRRNFIYVILCLALTIILFEFFLKK